MPDLERLRWIAETEFLALFRSTKMVRDKLCVVLNDGSYIDFWWSTQIPGRYAYHWERRHVDGTIYRHDNMPHPQWQGVQSFPKHFHAGDQDTVLESTLTADPEQALLEFLTLLVDQGPTARILALFTCRPDFSQPWLGRSHLAQVTLNRSPRRQAAELTGRVAHGKALPPCAAHASSTISVLPRCWRYACPRSARPSRSWWPSITPRPAAPSRRCPTGSGRVSKPATARPIWKPSATPPPGSI